MMELFMEEVEGWFLLRECKWFFWHLCIPILCKCTPFTRAPLRLPLWVSLQPPSFKEVPKEVPFFFEFYHETLLAFDGVILWRDLRNDTLCQSVSDSLTRVWVILWHVCSEFSQIWTPFAPFINSLCPFGLNPLVWTLGPSLEDAQKMLHASTVVYQSVRFLLYKWVFMVIILRGCQNSPENCSTS